LSVRMPCPVDICSMRTV
ncbi:hypothetical protein AVEN_233316-1, partial [Araneus ventricosus]